MKTNPNKYKTPAPIVHLRSDFVSFLATVIFLPIEKEYLCQCSLCTAACVVVHRRVIRVSLYSQEDKMMTDWIFSTRPEC